MKIGQIEKGKFRFVSTDNYGTIVKFGKMYESDEYGVIRLENDNELYTYGDRGTFIEQMELFVGSNNFIEVKNIKNASIIEHLVKTLKYGDMIEFGNNGSLFFFIGWCRNEAIAQNVSCEDIVTTIPAHWIRKVGCSSGQKTEEC